MISNDWNHYQSMLSMMYGTIGIHILQIKVHSHNIHLDIYLDIHYYVRKFHYNISYNFYTNLKYIFYMNHDIIYISYQLKHYQMCHLMGNIRCHIIISINYCVNIFDQYILYNYLYFQYNLHNSLHYQIHTIYIFNHFNYQNPQTNLHHIFLDNSQWNLDMTLNNDYLNKNCIDCLKDHQYNLYMCDDIFHINIFHQLLNNNQLTINIRKHSNIYHHYYHFHNSNNYLNMINNFLFPNYYKFYMDNHKVYNHYYLYQDILQTNSQIHMKMNQYIYQIHYNNLLGINQCS